MKVSFIVPCRDKAAFVEKTLRSVLAQSFSPMEIVFSDQGSVDGTFDIIKTVAASYSGPNTIRILECPDTSRKGMAGLNDHLNWLHKQITGDIVIMCSADDLNHPDRALHTVKAFEEHNPSYVGTCVMYCDPDGSVQAVTDYGLKDRFVDPVDNVTGMVGSSASSAWSRDLYEKYGPLRNIESQDVLLPFFATLERGIYYMAVALHTHIYHASMDNTGMSGVMRALKTEDEKIAYAECNNYHDASNWMAIIRRLLEYGIELEDDLFKATFDKALGASMGWAVARDRVTMSRLEPKAMRV